MVGVGWNSSVCPLTSLHRAAVLTLRSEGDHIKITASKFPFPTVCADKQSTDWFHAISRTLKWNERERQKSFVVVEEGPDQPQKKKSRSRKMDATPNAADRVKMTVPDGPNPDGELNKDDEQDEDDDEDEEEEEEEKFDIDDSSPEAATMTESSTVRPPTATPSVPETPALPESSSSEDMSGRPSSYAAQRAAAILGGGKLTERHSASGIDSPARFVGPTPHPPRVHSRHIVGHQYTGSDASDAPSTPHTGSDLRTPRPHDTQTRPLHHHLQSPSNNLAPHSAGLMTHAKKTASQAMGHRRGRSVGDPGMTRRTAFAVYGQDESDSNTSE